MPVNLIGPGGQGGNYTTIAAFEAALPAVMSANEEAAVIWTSAGNEIVVSAVTEFRDVDPNGFQIIIRPVSGQGFRDHANVLTNALRYSRDVGAAIRLSNSNNRLFEINIDNVSFVDMQLKKDTQNTYGACIACSVNGVGRVLDSCIIHNGGRQFVVDARGISIRNSVLVHDSPSNDANTIGVRAALGDVEIYSSTVVRINGTGAGTFGLQTTNASSAARNSGFFGFTTAMALVAGGVIIGGNNASNETINYGSGNQNLLEFAAQFRDISVSGPDFRIHTGLAESTGIRSNGSAAIVPAFDIFRTARPQGAGYDIGAYEVPAQGGGDGETFYTAVRFGGERYGGNRFGGIRIR